MDLSKVNLKVVVMVIMMVVTSSLVVMMDLVACKSRDW